MLISVVREFLKNFKMKFILGIQVKFCHVSYNHRILESNHLDNSVVISKYTL